MRRPVAALVFAVSALLVPFSPLAQQAPAVQVPTETPVELRFDIRRFQVDGNTLLPAPEIERIVAPFTGNQRDFGDVQKALEALEGEYRRRGYAAVEVLLPEQRMESGEVRLRVIEAKIRKMEVTGNRFFSEANVRASLPALAVGATPNASAVSRNLRLVNENPAKQTNVTLRAGEREGEVDAVVEVGDEKFSKAFVTFDNTGTGQTGYYRIGLGYQHANLFDRDHQITLQYTTSLEKPKQVSIYSVGYHLPFYSAGMSLDVYGGYSEVDAGASQTTAGTLTFTGRGSVAGLRLNQHLNRIGQLDHRLVLGIDYKRYGNSCALGAFGTLGCGTAAATFELVPLSLTYGGGWVDGTSQFSFYGTAIANLPAGNDSDTTAVGRARFQAKGDAKVFRFGGSWAKAFESDWQLRAKFDAQYTNEVLTSPDHFGIGGQNSVRGFLERERADDRGHFASVEIYTPDIAAAMKWENWSLRLLGFYDIGRTSRVNPQPGEQVHNGLASWGGGVRLNRARDFTLRFDVAQILDPGGTRERNHWRGMFSANLSF